MTKYAVQGINEEHSARAKGDSLQVSTKHCIEICNYLRRKNLKKAKELLQLSIDKKKAIPFKRFTGDVGHRKGNLTSGRYVVKACSEILGILNSVEANAQFKGINTSNLILSHICANKASTPWRYGRQTRRKAKRTNVEVVVEERATKKAKPKKEAKKINETKTEKLKTEVKQPEQKKVSPKQPVIKENEVSDRKKSEGLLNKEQSKPEVKK